MKRREGWCEKDKQSQYKDDTKLDLYIFHKMKISKPITYKVTAHLFPAKQNSARWFKCMCVIFLWIQEIKVGKTVCPMYQEQSVPMAKTHKHTLLIQHMN